MSLNHSFNIEVATKIGVSAAAFLNNIAHWVRENRARKINFHDNRTWTYNTEKQFVELFPYWSHDQIQKLAKKCVKHGYLLTGNFNKFKYDRTKWYTLSDLALSVYGLPNDTPQTNTSLITSNSVMEYAKPRDQYHIKNTTIKQKIKTLCPSQATDAASKLSLTKKDKEILLANESKKFADIWNKYLVDNLGAELVVSVSYKSIELKKLTLQWITNGKNSNDYLEYIEAIYNHVISNEKENGWLFKGKDNSKLRFQTRSRYIHYQKFHAGDWGQSEFTDEDKI